MEFKITILGSGTSTGVPLPGCRCEVCLSADPKNKRLRSSIVLDFVDGAKILVDTSPDLRYQALRNGITELTAVLLTHAHSDHILGFDDLRAFNFTSGKSVPCYATTATFEGIKRTFWYIFQSPQSYQGGMLTQVAFHALNPGVPFSVSGHQFTPIQLYHGEMEVMGYRHSNFAYLTDCNQIPEASYASLKNLDLLILDGLRYEPHKTHFTIPQAIEVAARIGAKRTYLTHLSHNVDYNAVMAKLPSGVELAYDGLSLVCT